MRNNSWIPVQIFGNFRICLSRTDNRGNTEIRNNVNRLHLKVRNFCVYVESISNTCNTDQRSARRQTALATCKAALLLPPDYKLYTRLTNFLFLSIKSVLHIMLYTADAAKGWQLENVTKIIHTGSMKLVSGGSSSVNESIHPSNSVTGWELNFVFAV